MVLVNALVRLSLDLSATPEARGMAKDWRQRPRQQVFRALRSAAEQSRAFIEHLKDGFLDIFQEAWKLEHVPGQQQMIRAALRSLHSSRSSAATCSASWRLN